MKISLNWLREYIDFSGDEQSNKIASPEELADQLMMLGIEVDEISYLGRGLESVVVGRIDEVTSHPQADKLVVCQVNVGQEQNLQIVCGAPNAGQGLTVPVALVGTVLPSGMVIKQAKLRGISSSGMLCSAKELLLSDDYSGLMELPETLTVGTSLATALNLNDVIMDLEITPNRPDCLSLLGIAREIGTTISFGHTSRNPLRKPQIEVDEGETSITDLTAVEVQDPDLCPRYAARVIQGIEVSPSPDWLQNRLRAVGLSPINNVVDVTNLVLMELGQPLHAFDWHKLADRRIVVRRARSGEIPKTLDEVDRALTEDMLVIADAERLMAVAGVMGGLESAISDQTIDILLESAYFSPTSIRRTSKSLGMHTDASRRFERGTDPEGVIPALNRATQLIQQLAGGTVAKGIIDVYPDPKTAKQIDLRPDRANQILGTEITRQQIIQILSLLGFEITASDDTCLSVTVPTYRPDIEREIDLVEEIARVYGYNRIPIKLPVGDIPIPDHQPQSTIEQHVKSHLLESGLMEAINYAFYHADMPKRLRMAQQRLIPIQNPLNEEFAVLRTSLLPSLLVNAQRNYSHQVTDIRLFEIARVFRLPSDQVDLSAQQLPVEQQHVAGVMVGNLGTGWYGSAKRPIDFYDLKGVIEGLLEASSVTDYEIKSAALSTFHPGRCAELWHNNVSFGVFGEVHPEVTESFDLSDRAYLFELNLDTIATLANPEKQFVPIPTHPGISRDLAILVDENLPADQPLTVIHSMGKELVSQAYLFDLYTGNQVPEGKKSLAYSIAYHAKTESLTDAEVDEVHNRIIDKLTSRFQAELRT
ncbi:MAG: phenylalanine--tRNA ligase subunit beta [Candidatus Poribacteria bacterium]|jgi:phenylalanyl-tRNA synthetase beta chain|nr:phenylalanine--tRNA ligase subunit beta [Candidatus Poribacteria bacterium]MDP6996124.1 phenylalanine--tRNA ligase subunit beta [Candidatus Poribacteria bacterium]